MILRLKQRMFSWLDSYDIYDETGTVYFHVEGKLALGHEFHIYRNDVMVGKLKQQVFRFLPHFDIYDANQKIGEIVKEFSLFSPRFSINFNQWEIEGDFMQWEYNIIHKGRVIASIHKVLFQFTDTYEIHVEPVNALNALMVVLAIDAVKCSKNK